MRPKEKAYELFNKMIDEIPPNQHKEIITFIEVDVKSAKQCALIAVNELIKTTMQVSSNEIEYDDKYWIEVEKEINKL